MNTFACSLETRLGPDSICNKPCSMTDPAESVMRHCYAVVDIEADAAMLDGILSLACRRSPHGNGENVAGVGAASLFVKFAARQALLSNSVQTQLRQAMGTMTFWKKRPDTSIQLWISKTLAFALQQTRFFELIDCADGNVSERYTHSLYATLCAACASSADCNN